MSLKTYKGHGVQYIDNSTSGKHNHNIKPNGIKNVVTDCNLAAEISKVNCKKPSCASVYSVCGTWEIKEIKSDVVAVKYCDF